MLILISSLLIFSCGTPNLPKGFDSEEVENRTREIIKVINTKDYDDIHALIKEDLQALTTPEQLKEGWAPMLDNAGEFIEINELILSGERGEKDIFFAMAIVKCEYENDNHIYTFYFDDNMELVGLYMK